MFQLKGRDMKTSNAMRTMIGAWEGCRLEAYRDPVGIWTIGYGHTGPDVKPGQRIDESEADRLLAADLARFEAQVTDMADDATNQQQFDALISFCYNLGPAALGDSTLLRLHNAGDYTGAAAQFVRWNHAGGKVLAGLTRRREEEAAVYQHGQYA